MSFPILTYVRTGENELTEILVSESTRIIDIMKVKDNIVFFKEENQRLISEDKDAIYNTNHMDQSITYFESMNIETEIPEYPEFEPSIISMCGILASVG